MSQRWRAVGKTASDLTGPRFEPQTSRFRDERVTDRPTGHFLFLRIKCFGGAWDISKDITVLSSVSTWRVLALLPQTHNTWRHSDNQTRISDSERLANKRFAMQREACYLGSFALRFVQLPLQVVVATCVDGDIVFDFYMSCPVSCKSCCCLLRFLIPLHSWHKSVVNQRTLLLVSPSATCRLARFQVGRLSKNKPYLSFVCSA